jgi:glucose-1-phosphate adenylyltransferase
LEDTKAFILAGGMGTRLSLLTRYRAKPAVPFAGKYRIIDFTMTNCVLSRLEEIYVLTQYSSRSLVRHLGIGKPWDLDHRTGGLKILNPRLGTADALFQNISILGELECKYVLILAGDHVYRMDYNLFLDSHVNWGKPASLGVVEVEDRMISEFGIITADSRGNIRKFEEKPDNSDSNLASMGIYIFDREFLIEKIKELKRLHSDLDFGKHIVPHLVQERMISAYRFGGYWLDVGTVEGYYTANMKLLSKRPQLKLYGRGVSPVETVSDEYPSTLVDKGGSVNRSLICNGGVIKGDVNSSVLSPGVVVEAGASVEKSIIFHDCHIKRGASVKNSIIDKKSVVGENCEIGDGDAKKINKLQPRYLNFGVTMIGRKTIIPDGMRVGTNCLLCGSQRSGYVPDNDLNDGEYYLADDS